jgi:hypothetical protein
MGYELTHADGSSFVFPGEEWWYVLELMRQYGWEAPGTTGPNPEGSWDGNYLATRGQKVRAEDAQTMASALELALPEIADADAADASEAATGTTSRDPRTALRQALKKTDPKEVLKGSAKERVRAFVDFARSGAFRIGEHGD